MSFTRSKLTRAAAAAIGAVSTLVPAVGQAQPASINATQLSVTVAPITISGTALGAEVSALGSGLTAIGVVPTIAADGSVAAAANAGAAEAGASFNYDVSVRSADQDQANNAFLAGSLIPTTQFGSQTGSFSNQARTTAELALSPLNEATVSAGTNEGVTATAIFSSTQRSDSAETQIRRIATSSNDQATFDTTRQTSRYQVGGSGLTAASAMTFGTAAQGVAPTITIVSGAESQANVAFTRTEQLLNGQNADLITASSTDITQPGYGRFTNTLGGTTAGAIDPASINGMTVLSGNAGTTSTLSLIQSLTAF